MIGSQLRTILWLRWRLSKNQWSRHGRFNAVLTILFVVAGLTTALAGGIVGIYAGSHALAKAPPRMMLLVWDAIIGVFSFFWMIGVMAEIQRSEAIDVGKLLHLPVSLKEVFLLNYLASLFTPSIILVLPTMLGLSVGLVLGAGTTMVWMLPLVISFILMITAWTYCLRGWLVALMVNKRRRQTIIVATTMAAIVLGQLPNLIFNNSYMRERNRALREMQRRQTEGGRSSPSGRSEPSARRNEKAPTDRASAVDELSRLGDPTLTRRMLSVHQYLPLAWTSYGAMSLNQGNPWPAVWGSAMAFLIGGLGLARAYRVTNHFYQQADARTPTKRRAPDGSARANKYLIERNLPGCSEEVSTLTLAFFRSLLRAPEVKMALLTPLIMLGVFGSMQISRRSGVAVGAAQVFTVTGVVGLTLLGMVQLMSNLFGFDRDGFRCLVLLPVRRQQIVLAKNLSFMPFTLGSGLVFLLILKVIAHLPWLYLVSGMLQLLGAFLLASTVGNYISIRAPYRIAPGSLKPTKTSSKTSLLIFGLHLLFPVAMVPVFLPAGLDFLLSRSGWIQSGVVYLAASFVLFATALATYRLSLRILGDLLQRREKEILTVVTQEVE